MHPSSDPSYRGYLLARLLRGHVVWPAVGLAATATYLLVLAGLRQVTSRLPATGDQPPGVSSPGDTTHGRGRILPPGRDVLVSRCNRTGHSTEIRKNMRTIIPSTVKTRPTVGRSVMLDAYTPLATYQPPFTRLGPARAARPTAPSPEAPRHARHRRPLHVSLPQRIR